jgi:hypothetical protein
MASETGKVTVSVEVPAGGSTVQVPPKQGPIPQPELPRTGADIGAMFALGMALAIAGTLLLTLTRQDPQRKVTMKHIKLTALIAALATVAMVGASFPAAADNVEVAVSNPGGTRALYVEDLAGNPLTALDFGTTRSLPFRVRVVDSTMDRDGFSVSATMTKLYVEDEGTFDYAKKIESANLAISSAAVPLNILDVEATVQPIVNTVSTITDPLICGLLGSVMSVLGGVNACRPQVSGITGLLQTVEVPIDLADLTNLPLLPQAAEAGAFTDPDYAGVGALDPLKPGSFTPTSRRMLAGSAIGLQPVLDALEAALDTSPRTDLVSNTAIVNGLAGQLPLWNLLSSLQVTTVLNSTVATVQGLLPAQIGSQSGTYMSFPVLNVTVPEDAPSGDYKGTLVVTALQP